MAIYEKANRMIPQNHQVKIVSGRGRDFGIFLGDGVRGGLACCLRPRGKKKSENFFAKRYKKD